MWHGSMCGLREHGINTYKIEGRYLKQRLGGCCGFFGTGYGKLILGVVARL